MAAGDINSGDKIFDLDDKIFCDLDEDDHFEMMVAK